MTGPAGRYLTLDAMRGLAAIAVAVSHLDLALMPHGHLAVDFFFALSGFVLTRAYDARLQERGRVGWFMEVRVVRLYPLFCAGILLGLLHAAQMTVRGADMHLGWAQIARATALGLLMLPDPFTASVYPTNGVFWSIATELLANLLFAVALARVRAGALYLMLIAAGGALIAMAVPPNFANSGALWSGMPLALVRTAFSFTFGLLIARWTGPADRRRSALALLPILVLCAVLAMPTYLLGGRIFELAAILVVFPVLLAIGARLELPAELAGIAAFLGDISYALYVIHAPIAHGAAFIARRLDLSFPAATLPYLAAAIVGATLLVHVWDKPVRRWLSGRLALRRSAMPQTL